MAPVQFWRDHAVASVCMRLLEILAADRSIFQTPQASGTLMNGQKDSVNGYIAKDYISPEMRALARQGSLAKETSSNGLPREVR
jgi:hypothetical protein